MSAFFLRGKGGVRFVTTIANTSAPTAAELAAGVALERAVTAIDGFNTQLNRVQTPVLAYRQELQHDGPETFADSGLTIIDDDGTGTDVDSVAYAAAATALVKGATGYLVFCRTHQTMAATRKVWVYPVRVGSVQAGWTMDATLASSRVEIVITGEPKEKVTVAA